VLSEFALLKRLAPYLADAADPRVALGVGDDAAVLRSGVCIAVDMLVEDVHFRRDLSSLADVGWKAIAVNVSDLAAMGARPLAAVVGLCRPAAVPVADVEALYEGMAQACATWDVALVGGDTVAAPVLALSVTALGEVDPSAALRRSGARPGDRIVVIGSLGAAAAALAGHGAGLDVPAPLLAAHRRPRALVAAGRVLAEHGATAAIDVSDGLGADLAHICAASDVRIRVHAAALPLAAGVREAATELGVDALSLAVGGGEDFALAAALPAATARAATDAARAAEGVEAAVVGEVLPAGHGPAVTLVTDDGNERDVSALGWDHFPPGE
jgi:thiamine-monophosphate kinase